MILNNKIILFFTALFFLVFTTVSHAQEPKSFIPKPTITYVLPFPGMLPDNPFYPAKRIRDKIVVFFRREPVKKSEILLHLSDKYLVMGDILWRKDEFEKASSILLESERYLQEAVLQLERINKNNIPAGYADKLELSRLKHAEFMEKLSSYSPSYSNILTKVKEINDKTKVILANLK